MILTAICLWADRFHSISLHEGRKVLSSKANPATNFDEWDAPPLLQAPHP